MSEALGLAATSLSQMSGARLLGIIALQYNGSSTPASLSQFAGWKFGQILSYAYVYNGNELGLFGTVYFTPSTSAVMLTAIGESNRIVTIGALQNVSATSLTVVSNDGASGQISIAFYAID